MIIDRLDRDDVGLFGNGESLTVNNLRLESVDITGSDRVGGLLGRANDLTTTETSVTGDVVGGEGVGGLVGGVGDESDIERSHATASVTGSNRVAGLVGNNTASTIEKSYATGTITGEDGSEEVGGLVGNNLSGTIRESYTTSEVSGDDNVGGLVGRNTGNIEESYAIGNVLGEEDVGGLVGLQVQGGESIDSYWDVPATGQNDSDGGTGIGDLADDPPADGMVGAIEDLDDGLAEDFDFTDTWETVSEDDGDAEEDDYPVLQALDRETQLEVRA